MATVPPSPTPPPLSPNKRRRQSSPDPDGRISAATASGDMSPTSDAGGETLSAAAGNGNGGKTGQSSNFRNVSACNRCRSRKNRCDQRLPSCLSCEKASVACVGYDPITKKEIPRSYVYYLETRLAALEALLETNGIAVPPAESLELCSRADSGMGNAKSPTAAVQAPYPDIAAGKPLAAARGHGNGGDRGEFRKPPPKADPAEMARRAYARHLGASSNLSFARVVFAAVQSSVSDQRSSSDKVGVRPYKPIAGNGSVGAGTSMRDSFFGLHTKPTIHPAAFPDRDLGFHLVTLYFEHANPQIPVLHRGDFMKLFEQAYAETDRIRGPKELYLLNMVFAIGGGIFMTDPAKTEDKAEDSKSTQGQPEEYHASAIVHLEACLSSSGGGLEELQAVLLLANFALLRPVPPGLWYIVGVAMRLAVDLGLHYEDGKDVDSGLGDAPGRAPNDVQVRERGRREYIRDQRRRLWWCTYSLDRLVSVCVGRPFGISDQVITTEFPSLLEDRYITPNGFAPPPAPNLRFPTYKLVAQHYFRLRLLQSEILQVLQYQAAQMTRAGSSRPRHPYTYTDLPSPFLSNFDSFRAWRIDIDRRLQLWKKEAPTKLATGVAFSTEFLELNYWQAVIMLYRQSLSVPTMFESEYHTSKEVESPTSTYRMELLREDEDNVYLKVAEAGQKILRLYRSLHLVAQVNYTYLATHHLFMAGISYLYAIWHSPVVRGKLTMDDVDFTILAATSVFTALIDKCPPAEACRDAFDRTARATIKMANAKGGFGQAPLAPSGYASGGGLSHRPDWNPSGDGPRFSKQARMSIDHTAAAQPDVYAAAPAAVPAGQALTAFQVTEPGAVKPEPDGRPSVFSVGGVAVPGMAPIDPSLLASAVLDAELSPAGVPQAVTSLLPPLTTSEQLTPSAPQSSSTGFSPSGLSFLDFQDMDFLQPGAAAAADGHGPLPAGTDPGAQMDLGFGLGWEGMHHDFSDGQQVDLFEGFFFGGQQGGGTGTGY